MKKKTLIIVSIVVCVLLGITGYAYFSHETVTLKWKDDQPIAIEYGQTYQGTINDVINVDDYSESVIKEMQLTNNITNQEGKEYPAVGGYKLTLSYKEDKIEKDIEVKDTVAPVFNETNEVTIEEGQNDFDFASQISATDLSNVKIEFNKDNIDFSKAGEYTLVATASDDSNNQTTKEIKVIVKAKAVVAATTTQTITGNNKVICIDPGHQARGNSAKEPNGPGSSVMKAKVTTGATGVATGNTESSINLKVGLKLQSILQQRGYTVVMCRTSQDVNISNAERAEIANNANAGAFVRLHCDSSDSSSPKGTMTMAPSTSNPYCASIASRSQALARAVLNNTCAITGSKSRGVSIIDTMTGLNWSKVPVTIIEMGFLSNPSEDRLLSDDAYQTKLATGIANGLDEFLK